MKQDFVAEIDKIGLFQELIGNVGVRKTQKTIPIVIGMYLKKLEILKFCEMCELGNLKRHTRPPRSAKLKNETKLLDIMHCDIQGHILADAFMNLHTSHRDIGR